LKYLKKKDLKYKKNPNVNNGDRVGPAHE